MKYTFIKETRLDKHDIGTVYDENKARIGTALYTISKNSPNCSLNHKDLVRALRLRMEYVLFENANGQFLHTFAEARRLFDEGEHLVGEDKSKYAVIDGYALKGDLGIKQEEIPF